MPDGPIALSIEGEPGIGKSTLWKEALRLAELRGHRVLSCRPAEVEAKFSYSAVGDLLEPVVDEVLPRLPKPQRRGLEAALLRVEVDPAAPVDQQTIWVAIRNVIGLLSQEGPLILAVDDAQWLDASSAMAVAYTMRRFDVERIGVLVTYRIGSDADLNMARFFPGGRLHRLSVAPLSLADLDRILCYQLGKSLPRPFLLKVHEVAGGNPLLALELSIPYRTKEFPKIGRSFPVPKYLVADVGLLRIKPLPRAMVQALRVASFLSKPTVSMVTAVLGDRAKDAIAGAADSGVIEVEGERISFSHPLLSSFAYDSAPPEWRRSVHRRLSEILTEPEESARHLALSTVGPDADAAGILEAAAHSARQRGAFIATAELLELAVELTPTDRQEDLTRRSIDASGFLAAAGDLARGRTLLERLARFLPAGTSRSRVLRQLAAIIEGTDRPLERKLLNQALQEASEDLSLQVAIQLQLTWIVDDRSLGAAHAETAVELAEQLGDPGPLLLALQILALNRFVLGLGPQLELLDGAVDLKESLGSGHIDSHPERWYGVQLKDIGELHEARRRLESLRAQAVARGEETEAAEVLVALVDVERLAGNWDLALTLAGECERLTIQTGREGDLSNALWLKAFLHALRGDVDASRSQAEGALSLAQQLGGGNEMVGNVSTVLGFLELSLENPADADRYLRDLPESFASLGLREPGILRFLPDEVEVLVALGDIRRAEEVLEPFEERSIALDRAWGLATSARCRGLIAAAQGNFEGAISKLEEALKHHERVQEPFELGRTSLVMGSVQRRAKQKRAARDYLNQSLKIFERLGASLWADKARKELSRIGGRAPAGPEGLTPTEQRVAQLVAEGKSNPEVAKALFISRKTVEANLSRIYAKLGVRSRTELAARFRSSPPNE